MKGWTDGRMDESFVQKGSVLGLVYGKMAKVDKIVSATVESWGKWKRIKELEAGRFLSLNYRIFDDIITNMI